MKNLYTVTVKETYTKNIDVWADDKISAQDEVNTMSECGEIEFDPTDDFTSFDIVDVARKQSDVTEITKAADWCRDIVNVTAIVDPDWVGEEMNEQECMDWLEQIRDRCVPIPKPVTSSDLWSAVLAYRVCK